MGADSTVVEATVLVGSLVDSLVENFNSAADLYKQLTRKQEKEDERRKSRRRKSFHEHDEEDSIVASGQLVRQEYDRAFRELGRQYSIGDILAQNQLQTQIIGLQNTLLTIYESNSHPIPAPIPHHLTRLLDSTRAARVGSLSALTQLYQRMIAGAPLSVQRGRAVPAASSSATTRTRSQSRSRDSDLVTRTRPTSAHSSYSTQRHQLFCLYALDLQERLNQPLADSFQKGGENRCPYCSCVVPLTEGKSWEIIKEDSVRGPERVFHIENRFLVKSHRLGKGFACVFCTKDRKSDTVTNSVRSLIDHIWMDHSVAEYEREIDMKELLVR